MTPQTNLGPRDYVHFQNIIKHRIIHIDGDIDQTEAYYVSSFVNYFLHTKGPVTAFINSGGGSVYHALAIYDDINSLNATHETEAIVSGICMSAATVILQAFKTRVARPNATFMIHEVFHASGGTLTAQDSAHKEAVRLQKLMNTIVADRLVVPLKKLNLKPGVNKYFTAEQALQIGLIDKILK